MLDLTLSGSVCMTLPVISPVATFLSKCLPYAPMNIPSDNPKFRNDWILNNANSWGTRVKAATPLRK